MPFVHARQALLPDGWARDVRVEISGDGRIAGATAGTSAQAGDTTVENLLPAAANLHSHTFQRAMAGMTERRGPDPRDSFWTWRELMYRFLDVLTPDEIEAIAAFAFMEMQEAGFSAVAEFHYLHNAPGGAAYADPAELSARIAAAAQATGIGLTLLPVYYAQGGVDGRPLKGGQMRFANTLDSFGRLVEGAGAVVKTLPADTTMGLAPHSLRAAPPAAIAELARWMPQKPFHMHIAEQEGEVDEALTVLGARPVEWLLANADVGPRWCLIHCTHMLPAETEALAATGAVAGLCPVTEANLGDGIFDAQRFLRAGGRLGVGSDSNIRITFNEELRQLEYSQRLRDRSRVVLAETGHSAGEALHGKALAGGAQALGRDSGAIAPGFWADLVAIDVPEASAFGDARPAGEMLDRWIFSGGLETVSDLWSAGRHSVREGRHVARDSISARYHAALTAIAGRL